MRYPFRIQARNLSPIVLGTIAIGLLSMPLQAQQKISAADQQYFEAKIRPILIDYCYECHGGDDATKGSLDLTTKNGSLEGGSSGPGIVPNDPGKSWVIKRIKDLGDPMPPPGGAKLNN